MAKKPLPLVYSCSGCSNVAQLANSIAVELDHKGLAQMSCIAGVGGNVPALVRIAKSGRPIVALDGCQLHCVKHCLQTQQIAPDYHWTLNAEGVQKRNKALCDQSEKEMWMDRIIETLELTADPKATC